MTAMTYSSAVASTSINVNRAPETERQPASPYLIRRNPAISKRARCARYRGTSPQGAKYEILERDCEGAWFLVSVFTVVNGSRR